MLGKSVELSISLSHTVSCYLDESHTVLCYLDRPVTEFKVTAKLFTLVIRGSELSPWGQFELLSQSSTQV